MHTGSHNLAVSEPSAAPAPPARYRGEVAFLYAYDLAYEMTREPLHELLGQPVAQFAMDVSKRSPRQLLFYRPQMVRLPALERVGPRGPVRVERAVKLLPMGAITITARVPFEVGSLDELVVYHDLAFRNGTLQQEVRQLAEEVFAALGPRLVRPVERLADDEAYTVFCLNAPAGNEAAEQWLARNRRQVAALLTQESDPDSLSRQEAQESTSIYLSYYEQDLVVVDWDAALIVDEPKDFDETLYLMELANLQLAELEAYDRLLDHAVERAYRDLAAAARGRTGVIRELRELRIDLSRLSDELSNIGKFFGDWHLARTYSMIARRFHLSEWHHSIEEKLHTLDDLYEILKHDENNRWMLILEITIVLLFVIDLALLFAGHR